MKSQERVWKNAPKNRKCLNALWGEERTGACWLIYDDYLGLSFCIRHWGRPSRWEWFEGPWPSHQRRQWQPTPVLLPEKSHGRRSLVGCSPWGRYESDMTEPLYFHFSLSCIGEGNGNPLQYSCLENPRDGRAWWAAVYGVAQSRTRLKRLSSSSSSRRPSHAKGLLQKQQTDNFWTIYRDTHR